MESFRSFKKSQYAAQLGAKVVLCHLESVVCLPVHPKLDHDPSLKVQLHPARDPVIFLPWSSMAQPMFPCSHVPRASSRQLLPHLLELCHLGLVTTETR